MKSMMTATPTFNKTKPNSRQMNKTLNSLPIKVTRIKVKKKNKQM